MSNCIKLPYDDLIAVAHIDEDFIKEFKSTSHNAKFVEGESWIVYFRCDGGYINVEKYIEFRISFTTRREMRFFLKNILKLKGAKTVPFYHSDEYDGFREVWKWDDVEEGVVA